MATLFAARHVYVGNGSVIDDGAVLVNGSTITAVGSKEELASHASIARTYDFGGGSIMPGMIDSHVHLGFDGSEAPVEHMKAWSDEMLLAVMFRSAKELLFAGVTTARELGARGHLALVVQEAVDRGVLDGPRLVVANEPITPTGGHCWFMNGEVDGELEIIKAVRERHKAGAQYVKVMATGGFMTHGSAPWHAQFSRDEMRVLVAEARRVDMRVAAHAHGTPGIINAVEAGVDTIEHCSWATREGTNLDTEIVSRIAERGIYVCATTNVRMVKPEIGSLSGRTIPAGVMDARRERLQMMYKMGVAFIAGTDSGIDLVPHGAYAYGLEGLAESGMPNSEIIVAATQRAAEALGVVAITGTLEAGKEADLIGLAGDPNIDLTTLRSPECVVARGKVFDRGMLSSVGIEESDRD
jgi:imidazolonepropionase-like amidohydrolase